ncbi:MAG: helix-turn-helix domain-containing protein [Bdellovibrionales bacterium]|nr:helix-turn-helix domain-containing protein [Bdellovibrionales bacterium]
MRNRPDAIEISVREASYRLGLTQRQVRNYIQARKIAAIKVGKEWFVDVASVQAFAQSHRLDIEKKVLADSQSEADHFFANEPTSQRANEPTSQRANEPTSQRANEPTSQRAIYLSFVVIK